MQARMKHVTNTHAHMLRMKRAATIRLSNQRSHEAAVGSGAFSSQYNPTQLTSGIAENSDRFFPNVTMSGNYSNPTAERKIYAAHSSRKFSNFPSIDTGLQATSQKVAEQSGLSKEEKKVTPAYGI